MARARTRRAVLALALLAVPGPARVETAAPAAAEGRIGPWTANPWYWALDGRPVLLLGASLDDNLFQVPDLARHLDAMAAAGANYVRNTLSDRRDGGFEVYAFARLPDGRYDLERWNEEYWRRLDAFLDGTRQRGIVVQIEVWDRFDLSKEHWEPHPFNPKNNVNYGYEESGFEREYPKHPNLNLQPFFFTTPAQRHNPVVLRHQERFVEELLRHTLPHPHVLYCIDNETTAEEAWALHWVEFIRSRAAAAGLPVAITEMWGDQNVLAAIHRRSFDHPERFDFVEVSQNNHARNQSHWDVFQTVRSRLAKHPRPINTVKTYGADGGRFGTTRDGVERWWRHLLGGGAAVRFHRPPNGLGQGELALASVRAARKLESRMRLWELLPANFLLRERDGDEAHLAARPGRAYALYFPDGGSVELDLRGHPGSFALRWIDVASGAWAGRATLTGGGFARVAAPGPGHFVAAIEAASGADELSGP